MKARDVIAILRIMIVLKCQKRIYLLFSWCVEYCFLMLHGGVLGITTEDFLAFFLMPVNEKRKTEQGIR